MGDSRIINVGSDNIGIRGLDQAIADMKAEFADRSDDEVANEMLARLQGRNYISDEYRDEYLAAFAREFRRQLGQPFQIERRRSPDLKSPMAGCSCMRKW